MTEAELASIRSDYAHWRPTEAAMKLKDPYVGTPWTVRHILALSEALSKAWAENARVTKELQEAEGREALLLVAGKSHPEPCGSRTTT